MILFTILYLMPLLQMVGKPVISSEITAGNAIIGFLLTSILGLLVYIWKDNKENSERKHKDIIALVDTVKAETKELREKAQSHDFQLFALNVAINLIQGKPYNYDNTKIPKE